ncbi:hypothetical protein HPB48_003450 [Haemaphysalis longicornis]|uniref:Calpain catalytic domain-containing protein n=1 Tax=Haemaphysalis longicornis TaxID=44386 RepID=A0A9J6GAQ3_HAELO|nr:hypothetical protein HPB48_003450 [Haemaphysalis longicornis]
MRSMASVFKTPATSAPSTWTPSLFFTRHTRAGIPCAPQSLLDQDGRRFWHSKECASILGTAARGVEGRPGRAGLGRPCRERELSAQPQLFAGDRVESDVCHDRPANAWFVTLCTVLANDPPLLAKVFPDHQQQEWREGTPHPGVFRFCFWLLGAWVEVLVDDRLPLTEKGLLYGCRSRTGSHFWAPLLEKAYAK